MSYWRKKYMEDVAWGVPGRGSGVSKRNSGTSSVFCCIPVVGHGGGEAVCKPLHTRCLTQQLCVRPTRYHSGPRRCSRILGHRQTKVLPGSRTRRRPRRQASQADDPRALRA